MPDLITIGVLALLAALGLGGAYWKGRKDEGNENDIQEADDYIDTRKRMDEARRNAGGSDDAEWLRERGKSGRNL